MMSDRVRQILSYYESENAGVLANLRRLLGTGTLADTGKLVILPVDQGWEHGPARSFAPNPAGYNPHYHFELALDRELANAGLRADLANVLLRMGRLDEAEMRVREALQLDPASAQTRNLASRIEQARAGARTDGR